MPLGIAIATSARMHGLGIVVYPPIPTAARSTRPILAETSPGAERSLLRLVLAAPRLPDRGRSIRGGGTLSLLIHASAVIALVVAGPLWRSTPRPVPGP